MAPCREEEEEEEGFIWVKVCEATCCTYVKASSTPPQTCWGNAGAAMIITKYVPVSAS